MLDAVHARVGDRQSGAPLYAVGVSLGGSALLNWIGRAGRDAASMLTAAAAVSTPLDLTMAGVAIGQGVNRIYAWHFLWTLRPKSLAMAERFPGLLDPERVRSVRSMYDFDEVVTAPLRLPPPAPDRPSRDPRSRRPASRRARAGRRLPEASGRPGRSSAHGRRGATPARGRAVREARCRSPSRLARPPRARPPHPSAFSIRLTTVLSTLTRA